MAKDIASTRPPARHHRRPMTTRCRGLLLVLATMAGIAGARVPEAATPSAPSVVPSASAAASAAPMAVRLLAFNDFHGQLPAGRRVDGRPVGGAAVFKAWLDAASAGFDGRLLIGNAGDLVGATPLASALLRDEPTLSFADSLGNAHCRPGGRETRRCNLVSTPGNHEFDKGRDELLRQLRGGNHPEGPFITTPWPGVAHPWVSANVVERASGRPLLPRSTVREVHDLDARGRPRALPVGFIGAVLRETPSVVAAAGIAGLAFTDEADAINREARRLQRQGVQAIVVLLHQGGTQAAYAGPTDAARPSIAGPVAGIVARLDPSIDVVHTGHTHQFGNALLPNAAGRPVLVTQAWSAGGAFAQIDLQLDPSSRDVVARSARIVTTWADEGPGLVPDAAAAALTAEAEARVAPRASRVVARFRGEIGRAPTPAGESALGNLVADAHAATMGTRIAFTNPGGLRADLSCAAGAVCDATYGRLFGAQPFGNVLVRLELTGDQIRRLLEQQWQGTRVRLLPVAGLRYAWDARRIDGQRCRACIVELREAGSGRPIEPARRYPVTVNSYLADGGDDFAVLLEATARRGGPLDVDGLADWFAAQPQPVVAPPVGERITRLP